MPSTPSENSPDDRPRFVIQHGASPDQGERFGPDDYFEWGFGPRPGSAYRINRSRPPRAGLPDFDAPF